MRKNLSLLIIPIVFISSCVPISPTPSSFPTPTPTVSDANKLITTDSKKVEIEILNPSSSEKNLVDWYQDDTKTLVMKVNAKAKVIGTVTLKDQTKSSNIKWSSSDNTLVVINDEGIIQANKIGNTTILATSFVDPTYKQVLNVKVVDEANFTPEKLTEVEKVETKISKVDENARIIDNNNLVVLAGAKIKAVGHVFLKDNTENNNVIWSSSDETIATVDESGNITIKDTVPNDSVVTVVAKYRLNPQSKQVIHINVVSEILKGNILPQDKNLTPIVTITPKATPVITPNSPLVGNETKGAIGLGYLLKAGGIAFKNGKIYVTDRGITANNLYPQGVVKIFDTTGALIATKKGVSGNELPENLTSIVTDGDRMWFTSIISHLHNLYSFDSAGNNRVDSQVGLINQVGYFSTNPTDMAIDPSSNTIYVADGLRLDGQLGNIIKLTYNAGTITDQNMDFISSVKPAGLCIDDLGNILVVSNATTTNQVPIIKYSKNGTEVLRFTTAGKNSAGPSGVSSVGDIAYDPRNGGTIYVLAQLGSKTVVLRFDSQGNFIRYFGEDANMSNPVGMEVGSDGTVYVLNEFFIYQFGPAKS